MQFAIPVEDTQRSQPNDAAFLSAFRSEEGDPGEVFWFQFFLAGNLEKL